MSSRVALQSVDAAALLSTIGRVSKSASRDESRPVLTGIFVSFEGGKLVMAATDSYRLAVKETAAPGPLPDLEAIIPARALQELSAHRRRRSSTVELALQENHVVFGAEGIWLTTRRIDGQFPNYRQLLPEQFEHELELPREELLDVVRRVGLLAQRNSPLRLRFAEGELTVSARTQDVGEAKRVAAGAVHRRAARDRLQRRVPARRPRVDRLRDRALEADQPAPPRRAPGRDAGLHVPDHADPPRRLIRVQRLRRHAVSSGASARTRRSSSSLASGLVLVTGENGAGKTNLLEALHVGTQGFSPRTRSDGRLIRFGETGALVALRVERRRVRHEVRVKLAPPAGKSAELDGSRLASAESLRREFPTLVFTPDRLAVVKGGPAVRRAYLDRVLARLSRRSGRCRRTTPPRSRSATRALRRAQLGLGAAEPSRRGRSASRSSVRASSRRGGRPPPRSSRGSRPARRVRARRAARLGVRGGRPTADAFERASTRDLARGATGLGPHLDDLVDRRRGRELRGFGSQGEQRLAVLSLLLAEAALLSTPPPLLLLDDVLSELDSRRRGVLAEAVAGLGQTVITATHASALPAEPDQVVEVTAWTAGCVIPRTPCASSSRASAPERPCGLVARGRRRSGQRSRETRGRRGSPATGRCTSTPPTRCGPSSSRSARRRSPAASGSEGPVRPRPAAGRAGGAAAGTVPEPSAEQERAAAEIAASSSDENLRKTVEKAVGLGLARERSDRRV